MHNEPLMDVAHLGHLELLTPRPEESLRFFVDVMGMTETGREGDSVYLHAYDDYERHSLKLTASRLPGLGHVAYRTRSPQALERRVAALKGSGFDIGWTSGDLAHGPAFLCQDPDGHKIELYNETQWYQPPPELRPALKTRRSGSRRAASTCAAWIIGTVSPWTSRLIASFSRNTSAFA